MCLKGNCYIMQEVKLHLPKESIDFTTFVCKKDMRERAIN